MRFLSLIPLGLTILAGVGAADSEWSFEDATLSVQRKGAGAGATKEKLSPKSPLSTPVSLGPSDSLKIILTTTDGGTPKRPHQAFLTLHDPIINLEDSFPLNVKENGKAKVDLTHKDIPTRFLTVTSPLRASLVIAAFGSSTPLKTKVFDLMITRDPNVPLTIPDPPLRYGKLPEIHHVFRADPKSPPKIITLVFAAAVIATLPILLGTWLTLGANLNQVSRALGRAPMSHALFVGSVLALEGIFFMYYTRWNLFQTLPVAAAIGSVTFLSGSRALSEVQERRLAGMR